MAVYELKDDPVYDLLKQYPLIVLDYCVMKDTEEYHGTASHRDAVECAIKSFSERDEEDFELAWEYDMDKAAMVSKVEPENFFAMPGDHPKGAEVHSDGIVFTSFPRNPDGRTLPYWFAFLNPPHTNPYSPDDLMKVDSALFPMGTDELIIYEWSTDWSDYFDDGHEWWGACCWSIYDPKTARFTVIMASATD